MWSKWHRPAHGQVGCGSGAVQQFAQKIPLGHGGGSVWVKSQKTCVYAFLNVNYPQSHVLPWSHGGLRMCEIAPSPHPPASMPFTMLLHARGVQPAGRGQHDGAALDTKDQGQQEHLASRLTCRTTRKLGLHVFWWDVFHQQWAVVLCTLQTAIRTPLPGFWLPDCTHTEEIFAEDGTASENSQDNMFRVTRTTTLALIPLLLHQSCLWALGVGCF